MRGWRRKDTSICRVQYRRNAAGFPKLPCTFLTPRGVAAETRRGFRCGCRDLHALPVVNDCFALGQACCRNPVVEVNGIARWKMGRERLDAARLGSNRRLSQGGGGEPGRTDGAPKCRACKQAAPRR